MAEGMQNNHRIACFFITPAHPVDAKSTRNDRTARMKSGGAVANLALGSAACNRHGTRQPPALVQDHGFVRPISRRHCHELRRGGQIRLRRIFTFSDRAVRSEYWWYVLFNLVVALIISFVEGGWTSGVGDG